MSANWIYFGHFLLQIICYIIAVRVAPPSISRFRNNIGSSCLEEETIDKALIRAQKYLNTIKANPKKDDGRAILSSPLVVDYGNMQIEDFFTFKSNEKVMLASIHAVLKKVNNITYDELISELNNVVLLKKPAKNGFIKMITFSRPQWFWTKDVNTRKLEKLTKWFNLLVDDPKILNTTKFMNSISLNLFEMSKASVPYLNKACAKSPKEPPNHEIVNLVVLQYPTLKDHQIKVYEIEISLVKVCSARQFVLRGKFNSYRFKAQKIIINKMSREIKRKISKELKMWIESEAIRRLFDDDFFIVKNWFLHSKYNE